MVSLRLVLQFNAGYLSVAKAPLETLGLENEYDILVKAHGGGLTGQSDSIRLGVARFVPARPRQSFALKITVTHRRRAEEIRFAQSGRHLSSLSVRRVFRFEDQATDGFLTIPDTPTFG